MGGLTARNSYDALEVVVSVADILTTFLQLYKIWNVLIN